MKQSALFLIFLFCSLGVFAQTSNELGFFFGGNSLRASYFPEYYSHPEDLASQYEPYFKDISVPPVIGMYYIRNIGRRLGAGVSASFGTASGVCVDPATNKTLYTRNVRGVYFTPRIRYYYMKGRAGAMFLGSNLLLGFERQDNGAEGSVSRNICALSIQPYGFKINLREYIGLFIETDAGLDFIGTKLFVGIRGGVSFNL